MHNTNLDSKRWFIAIMGTCFQICLGTFYAWSFFQKPFSSAFGWSQSLTAWTFCLTVAAIGIFGAIGGIILPKVGPRKLAVSGGILFGLGYITGALALKYQSAYLLFLTYGIIGGCGLGMGYVTPVATVAKWFPDKKGLATGMVVMGFGFGALFMSKIFAPMLFNYFGWETAIAAADIAAQQSILVNVFLALGVIFLILTIPIGSMIQNPPENYIPAGYTPITADTASFADSLIAKESILSGRFLVMWLIFFFNIIAGLAIIGFQSPLFQDIWAKWANLDMGMAENKLMLAAYGGTLIAITSIFNGVGRIFWGGFSDKIGRIQTFRIMLGTQALACIVIAHVGNPWMFAIILCYVLFCYGGGFGTMPSFVVDVFGAKVSAAVYGAILTAWGVAGFIGPQIIAFFTDNIPHKSAYWSFIFSACVLTVGFLISCLSSNKPFEKKS